MTLILYGIVRFLIEYLRDDNPFEHGSWIMYAIYNFYKGGTVAQNLYIYLVVLGLILMAVFQRMKPKPVDI